MKSKLKVILIMLVVLVGLISILIKDISTSGGGLQIQFIDNTGYWIEY